MHAAPTELIPCASSHVGGLLTWIADADELERWCGRTDHPLATGVVAAWHADPDVTPFVLVESGRAIAYGEVWVDRDEREIELARLVVAPDARGRGHGRTLVRELVERSAIHRMPHAYMRVHPDNVAALRCYARTDFEPVSAADQAAFNRGQPREYVWLRLPLEARGE